MTTTTPTRPRVTPTHLVDTLVRLRADSPGLTRCGAITLIRASGKAVSWERLTAAWRLIDRACCR